jgi:endonuclease/exonuclease/phosphatase family metal-dependent hydrolase
MLIRLFKRIIKSAGWISFVLTLLTYALAAMASYISPKQILFIHTISFGFPIVMIVLLVWLIVFIWRKKPLPIFVLIVSLLASFPVWNKVVGLSLFAKNSKAQFTVLNWNIARFGYGQNFDIKFPPNRDSIVHTIQQLNADVMCLQEFWFVDSPLHKWNHKTYFRDSLGYPYVMFTNDFNWSAGSLYGGNIIFSKYPIITIKQEKLISVDKTEDVGIVDIAINSDTIRILNFHLMSNKFSTKDVKTIEGNNTQKLESTKEYVGVGKGIFKKLSRGFEQRATQAEILQKIVGQSPHPVIACGDFNDIPNSYSYRMAFNGLQDSFLEKGLGWGRTYTDISPTLRIDYMMHSPMITCNSFERLNRKQSDHYGILGGFTIGKH